MRRPGAALIAVRAFDAVKVYLPFMLLQGGFASRLPEVLHLPWQAFVWLYTLSRVHVLLFDWLTTAYRIDEHGITLRRGWPASRTTTVAWADVASLTIDQDVIHRLLGRHRATVVVGAETQPNLVLEVMGDAEVEALRRGRPSEQDRPSEQGWPFEARSTRTSGTSAHTSGAVEPLHRTSWVDLLVVAATYGQVALVVPFAVSSYGELAEWLPLPSDAEALGWLLSGGPWLLAAASVVAGLAYGLFRAWLRFGGHEVRLVGDRYEVTRSAVDRGTGTARAHEVVGVRIDQNPLMRVLGLGTLHLVLGRGQGTAQALTVLPIARLPVIERHVATLLPGIPPPPGRPHAGPVLAVGVVALAVAAALLAGWQPWLAGLALLVGLWLADRAATSLAVGADCLVVHQRGWASRRTYLLASGALRAVATWRVGRTPWSGTTLTLLDRAPVALRAWGTTDVCVDRLFPPQRA